MKRAFAFAVAVGFAAVLFIFVSPSQSRPKATVNYYPQQPSCSLESIKGAYGFYRSGTTPAGPLAGVGITTFDGHGGSSTVQSIRSNGVDTLDLFTDGTFEASYSVNSSCAAQFINPDGSLFGVAVVVGGGEEIYIMSLSDHNTITGVMKRINPLLVR